VSLENEALRGQMAASVLDNPVYAESYTLIEQEITRLWRESRDADEREQLHQLLRMLDKARNVLESTMRSGKVAAKELQRQRSLPERIGLRPRRA
jgi:hypothetical protein